MALLKEQVSATVSKFGANEKIQEIQMFRLHFLLTESSSLLNIARHSQKIRAQLEAFLFWLVSDENF